jgi:hypothetical protein
MTVIRVEPASVEQYGRQAQATFDLMHRALSDMVRDVVTVRYSGPNAVAFKTDCGRLAVEFAGRFHADLATIADAVRISTSNIATALGGQAIHLRVDARPIVPPTPDVVEFVDVDTSALEALVPLVARCFAELRTQLSAHLEGLRATDWEGHAKTMVVERVAGVTASSRSSCDASEQALTGFVREQVRSVELADR